VVEGGSSVAGAASCFVSGLPKGRISSENVKCQTMWSESLSKVPGTYSSGRGAKFSMLSKSRSRCSTANDQMRRKLDRRLKMKPMPDHATVRLPRFPGFQKSWIFKLSRRERVQPDFPLAPGLCLRYHIRQSAGLAPQCGAGRLTSSPHPRTQNPTSSSNQPRGQRCFATLAGSSWSEQPTVQPFIKFLKGVQRKTFYKKFPFAFFLPFPRLLSCTGATSPL